MVREHFVKVTEEPIQQLAVGISLPCVSSMPKEYNLALSIG